MRTNTKVSRLLARLAVLGAMVLVSACASAPPPSSSVGFSETAAREVFHAGLTSIQDRYIKQVDLNTVTLEAVRGLGAIDPDVTILRDGNQMVLFSEANEFARVSLPDTDEPDAWADLAVRVTGAARNSSREIRTASDEKIYEAVFDGMISELDVYSRYAGREEARRQRSRRDGFGGVGISIRGTDRGARVTRVTPGSPADGAGLEVDDLVVAVDGEALDGLEVWKMIKAIRGPQHSEVVLQIERGDEEPFEASMTRHHIVPATVTATLEEGIAVLRISSFNQNTARSAAQKFHQLDAENEAAFKGAIVDLRGNPGGLLRQSIQLANLFIAKGQIVSTQGRHPDSVHHYEADERDILNGRPLVVLVDGKSASAAEVVAAALHERRRAVLVGTASYGKGTVQTVIRMPNDGELTMTWSRLVAPNGSVLHGAGVAPVVCTSSASPYAGEPVINALEEFRLTTPSSGDERVAFRKLCPPERHDDDADLRVARQLIEDPILYERALRPLPVTAQIVK